MLPGLLRSGSGIMDIGAMAVGGKRWSGECSARILACFSGFVSVF